jgi:hypothetical protein
MTRTTKRKYTSNAENNTRIPDTLINRHLRFYELSSDSISPINFCDLVVVSLYFGPVHLQNFERIQ